MSALIQWRRSPLYPIPEGTATILAFHYDWVLASFQAWAADSNSRWTVASHDKTGSIYWIVLKRKNGSAGRLLFLFSTSSVAIGSVRPGLRVLNTGLGTNYLYPGWFPFADVDTPLGFTGAGNVFGPGEAVHSIGLGTAAGQPITLATPDCNICILESEVSIILMAQRSSGTQGYQCGAGDMFDDFNGDARQGTFVMNSGGITTTAPSSSIAWTAASQMVLNPENQKKACQRSATFLYESSSALEDASNSRAYFLPIYASAAGEYHVRTSAYKFRQMAQGPQIQNIPGSSWQQRFTSGPTLQAINLCGNTAGGSTATDWAVNFPI